MSGSIGAARGTEPSDVGASTGRIPALDGLRGLAVVLVVLAHANVPLIRYGGIVGVSLFFVLSGYLITSLLVAEQASEGRVALGAFYARRALRLLPASVVAVAGGAVLAVAVGFDAATIAKEAAASLLYVGNIRPWFGLPQRPPFSHFWTLAMEEQFYLVWPLVISATGRWARSRLVAVVVGLGVLSLIARFALPISTTDGYRVSYYFPHTNAYGLLFGSALAVWVRQRTRPLQVSTFWWRASLGLFLFAATVPGLRDGLRELDTPASLVTRISVAPIGVAAAVVLVLAVGTRSPSVPSWLSSPTLLFFGGISYGLYLWHEILDAVIGSEIGTQGVRGLIAGTVSAVLAVGFAVASRRFVEAPFLRRKARFERARLEPV